MFIYSWGLDQSQLSFVSPSVNIDIRLAIFYVYRRGGEEKYIGNGIRFKYSGPNRPLDIGLPKL